MFVKLGEVMHFFFIREKKPFKPHLSSRTVFRQDASEFAITVLSCVPEERDRGVGGGEAIAPQSPAVPAVWGTSDVSTEKVMGSSVKIVACPADNDDSRVNQGVVADVWRRRR